MKYFYPLTLVILGSCFSYQAAAAAEEGGGREVVAYAVGGGGDTAVALTYLKALMDQDPSLKGTAVAAGYNLAHYQHQLTRNDTQGRPAFAPDVAHSWLRFVLKLTVPEGAFGGDGYLKDPSHDPLFYKVADDALPPALAAAWQATAVGYESASAAFKYGTCLDEYLIRRGMSGRVSELYLLSTIAAGERYRSSRNAPMLGQAYDDELRATYGSLKRFLMSKPKAVHTLIDVGGDLLDFNGRGRDSNLLAMLLHIALHSTNELRPKVKLLVFGTGVDGHATPDLVEAKLQAMRFHRIDPQSPASAPFIEAMLPSGSMHATLSALGALRSNRATRLFLDTLAAAESAIDRQVFQEALSSRTELAGKPERQLLWQRYFEKTPNDKAFATMAGIWCKDFSDFTDAEQWASGALAAASGFSQVYQEIDRLVSPVSPY